MQVPFRVLAIETSCDDTAVSIVSSCRRILSNVIIQQHKHHNSHGGIVPQLAAHLHRQNLPMAIKRCIKEAGFDGHPLTQSVSAIAATRGPGLGASLSAGYESARCIAAANGLPFYGIHHMEGHALTARLGNPNIRFPFLALLISGGHTLLLVVRGVGEYTILGSTLDDSIGEALDKATRMLQLPSLPGESPAASLEQAALGAKGEIDPLPVPLKSDPSLNFSFSGLKTALKYRLEKINGPMHASEFAFEFQRAATRHLEDRLERALKIVGSDISQVVMSGGVAKNQYIRTRLSSLIKSYNKEVHFAPMELCSDNAAMIGWTAIENINAGSPPIPPETHLEVMPNWPLDQLKFTKS